MRKILSLTLVLTLLGLAPLAVLAQSATPPEQEIYGNQMMTPDERLNYNSRMQSLTTTEEREAYRLEHRRRMQDRAQKQGLQLDEPGVMNPYQSQGMSGAQ